MADLSKAQQKRAEARQRRRGQAQPEPEPENATNASNATNETNDGQDTGHGVLQAAKIAAAAGAAGAAVVAAKALTSHDDDAPTKEAEQPDQPEPESTQEPEAAEEPEAGEEPQASEEAEPEREPEPREESQPVAGAAQSDTRRALDRAREQLEDLLGRPVEQVSSLERTHDGWVLALEVVELQRIPETTDVLASYEMELDDELNLRRYQQVRRYNRGRTDQGDDR